MYFAKLLVLTSCCLSVAIGTGIGFIVETRFGNPRQLTAQIDFNQVSPRDPHHSQCVSPIDRSSQSDLIVTINGTAQHYQVNNSESSCFYREYSKRWVHFGSLTSFTITRTYDAQIIKLDLRCAPDHNVHTNGFNFSNSVQLQWWLESSSSQHAWYKKDGNQAKERINSWGATWNSMISCTPQTPSVTTKLTTNSGQGQLNITILKRDSILKVIFYSDSLAALDFRTECLTSITNCADFNALTNDVIVKDRLADGDIQCLRSAPPKNASCQEMSYKLKVKYRDQLTFTVSRTANGSVLIASAVCMSGTLHVNEKPLNVTERRIIGNTRNPIIGSQWKQGNYFSEQRLWSLETSLSCRVIPNVHPTNRPIRTTKSERNTTTKLPVHLQPTSQLTKISTGTLSTSAIQELEKNTGLIPNTSDVSQNKTGITVGASIGSVVLMVGIILIVIFILRRHQRNINKSPSVALRTEVGVVNNDFKEDSPVYQDPTITANSRQQQEICQASIGNEKLNVDNDPTSDYYSNIGPSTQSETSRPQGNAPENPSYMSLIGERKNVEDTYYSIIPDTQSKQVVVVTNDQPTEDRDVHPEISGATNSTTENPDYFVLEPNSQNNLTVEENVENYFVLEN